MRFNEVDSAQLGETRCYNLSAFSVWPDKLFKALRRRFPKFTVDYKLDFRNDIARAWPKSMDCSSLFRALQAEPEHDFEESLDITIRQLQTEDPNAAHSDRHDPIPDPKTHNTTLTLT